MGTYANFYNSDNGDRVYDADSFSEWLRPFFKTGVFNGELQVMASSGMEVIVDTGNAFIEGKLKKFDSQTTLTVEQASANSTRIDSIICRRNDTDRDFTLMIVKGTTVAPLPVRENGIYDIVLAHITVPASAVEIKQENITDTRMDADICGWVVSNVEEVDFSQVSAQWADYIANFEADELQAFNEWFDTIKGQLSTDQAGSLQLQIDEQANKIATNTANISANKADITSLQQTTQTNTSDIATNKSDIQAIKARDDEQDSKIANLNNATRINLLKPTLQTQTLNGVTCTNNGDGTYTLNGTATSEATFAISCDLRIKGTFKLLGLDRPITESGVYINIFATDNYLPNYVDSKDGCINSTDKTITDVQIHVQEGNTTNNLVIKPMLTTNLNATYDDFVSYEDSLATNRVISTKPVTLGTSWTQDTTNGYYTQSIICSGITSNDNPPIDVVLSGTLAEMQTQQDEWGKILKVETSTNTLKFYVSEPTTVSLSVMVKGV